MKPRFKTHEEISEHYISTGQLTRENINEMNRELGEIKDLMTQARINVKKRRGFIKHCFIVLATEFPFPMLGYTHPEEEAEYRKLSSQSKSNRKKK